MTTFPSDEAFARTEALVKELEGQTDRGATIVGAAWVEEALLSAIETFLVKDKKAWDRLFRQSGPMSSFAAKIDLAQLLGMTSKVINSDLHILRSIRNEFAHSIFDKENAQLSLATPHIRDKCLALQSVAHEKHTNPRNAYIRTCAILNSDFYLHRFFGHTVADGGRILAHTEQAVTR